MNPSDSFPLNATPAAIFRRLREAHEAGNLKNVRALLHTSSGLGRGLPEALVGEAAALYPALTVHDRNRLLASALEGNNRPLSDALLALRPPEDPLPWRGWLLRQRSNGWADWDSLPPGELARADRTGCDVIEVFATHARAWSQLATAPDRIRALAAGGAPVDGTPARPGATVLALAGQAEVELLPVLFELGAPSRAPGRRSPLTALATYWAKLVWKESSGKPSVGTWEELCLLASAPEHTPSRLGRCARSWSILVAAGLDPEEPDGSASPFQLLARSHPEWAALWQAHALESSLVPVGKTRRGLRSLRL